MERDETGEGAAGDGQGSDVVVFMVFRIAAPIAASNRGGPKRRWCPRCRMPLQCPCCRHQDTKQA